ncbi:flagellin [Desulfonatronum zhilinae]|nr:flagellin [Desulfonatronum zhilinae]
MALSDLQRLVVYDTANQLWQQDMLMNAYFHGSSVGANLRSMILGRQPVQPLTNPFDEAITGKLRADSATIRQNARNVREAGSMMGIAKEAVSTIKGLLEEMEALAKKVKEEKVSDPSYDTTDDQGDYEALRKRITGIIESTRYNNISLLDGSQWGTEQISADGKVHIQGFPDGGFDLTFRALDSDNSDFNWDTDLTGAKLDADPDEQLITLSGYIGDMTLIEDIYSNRQDGLEYQAASLESQADLLDQAVEARRHVPTKSLEQILLDLLFRNSGRIVDETG